MTDRQRIVHGRVVAAHRIEIRPQQEARSARHRHPHLRRRIGLRERLAVGAGDAGARPGRIAAAAARCSAGRADFIAPMLATVIFPAIDQITRGGTERIVRLAEWRHPAVAIVIDADIEPDLGHPLGVSHRAGPRSPHLLRRAPAAIDDAQRIDQLRLPIGAAAGFVPGERGQRRKYRPHMVLLDQGIAEGGFDAPQRQQRAALDAEFLFDPCKQRFVFLQRLLAGDDAPVRDAAIDVLPDLFVEFRLVPHLLEHGHVGFDAAHHACISRVRNALRQRARTKAITPLVEARGCRGKRGIGMGEQGGGTNARTQQRAAHGHVRRIKLFHQGILAVRCGRRQSHCRAGTSHPGAGLRQFWTSGGRSRSPIKRKGAIVAAK